MSLGRAVNRAHRVAKELSLSYTIVAQVLKRILVDRSRAFCARFTTNVPQTEIMKLLRVENCTRMLDHHTWQFIEHGRKFVQQIIPDCGGKVMSMLDWKNAIA